MFKLISKIDILGNTKMSLDECHTDDKSILVQVMARCRQAKMTPHGVTRPQWGLVFYICMFQWVLRCSWYRLQFPLVGRLWTIHTNPTLQINMPPYNRIYTGTSPGASLMEIRKCQAGPTNSGECINSTVIRACISNYGNYKVWDKTTYPLPNFKLGNW